MSIELAVRTAIEESALDSDVVRLLLPDGQPYDTESQLWDYKAELPTLDPDAGSDAKKVHKAEIAELVKDAVAFYNALGGYIVFGVRDKGNSRVIGCDDELDVGDFNQRIEASTGISINCIFRRLPVWMADGTKVPIAALLVPRRPDGEEPAAFKKPAPTNPEKPDSPAWRKGDVYVRFRDQCRPAQASSADWKFIHGQRAPSDQRRNWRRKVHYSIPPRDAELIRFVGREEVLSQLRSWIMDKKSPVRLLTGIGGLGKTSAAYRFSEEIIETCAADVEWVVWLTAKEQTYSAVRGSIVEASRVDFRDLPSLIIAILDRLGARPIESEDEGVDDLIENLAEALQIYSCFIVVDDVDSLSVDVQKEVIGTLFGVANRTIRDDLPPSRILFTSRMDHGLPPGSVIKMHGLLQHDFEDYVKETANKFSVPLPRDFDLRSFFQATSGSPLFAASVLRLAKTGRAGVG